MGTDSRGGPNGSINVTPLVDVCLVLLIIFMVMIPSEVPEISVRTPPRRIGMKVKPSEPLVVGLREDGSVTLNRQAFASHEELGERIRAGLQSRDRKNVFVDFDDEASYAEAIAVLDLAKRSGAQSLTVVHKRNWAVPDTMIGI